MKLLSIMAGLAWTRSYHAGGRADPMRFAPLLPTSARSTLSLPPRSPRPIAITPIYST